MRAVGPLLATSPPLAADPVRLVPTDRRRPGPPRPLRSPRTRSSPRAEQRAPRGTRNGRPEAPTYDERVDFSFAFTPDLIAVFVTLFVLEIVLGVDNVIFISILASKLPKEQQAKARNLGLTLAMLIRVLLVFFAGWIITLKEDIVVWFGIGFSWKDFILIAGGLFLVYKAVTEIHHKLEGAEEEHSSGRKVAQVTFASVITQILLLDIVFSLDSVITAVGMTENLVVIITVVVLSFGIMLFASRFIFTFVNKHPTVKMLALSFLLLIGVFLDRRGLRRPHRQGAHLRADGVRDPRRGAEPHLLPPARPSASTSASTRCSCVPPTPTSTNRSPWPPPCRRRRMPDPSVSRASRSPVHAAEEERAGLG